MPQTSKFKAAATTRPTADACLPLKTDPLADYIARQTRNPVPLISTDYAIVIQGGFVAVTATRRFRNAEANSIEATLTFPVPVHAVLHHLEAQIGARKLIAKPLAREKARETYEDALEKGKTAVLHEELLRGVHLLSVGHIAPGTEIVVAMRWSMLATCAGDRLQLRIPLTVGDIYGCSGLNDSDELTHAASDLRGTLSISCDAPILHLNGVELTGPVAGRPIPLNAPIDIEINCVRTDTLEGRMADGRSISLLIAPADQRQTPIDAAILIDRSGSMNAPVSGDGATVNKHVSVLLGLSEAANGLRDGDRLGVWQFDDRCQCLGQARSAKDLREIVRKLDAPGGGTEIGRALADAVASGARDVILVTDGKSHAMDIQGLARSGCRFTAVLVGEDSLEANAGHLAALTGGAIFAALGADVSTSVAAAIASVRAAAGERAVASDHELVVTRAGLRVGVAWSKGSPDDARSDVSRAVAALAASLALPSLIETEAVKLALAEGLVGHLTSLVLVDEDGASTDDHAANRKIALPTPRTMAALAGTTRFAMARSRTASSGDVLYALAGSVHHSPPSLYEVDAAIGPAPERKPVPAPMASSAGGAPPAPALVPRDLAAAAGAIDWQLHPQRLIAGDAAVLPADIAVWVVAAAKTTAIETAARRLGIDAVALVIGLMARSRSGHDRLAARIARAILKSADASVVDDLMQKLRLPAAKPQRASGP